MKNIGTILAHYQSYIQKAIIREKLTDICKCNSRVPSGTCFRTIIAMKNIHGTYKVERVYLEEFRGILHHLNHSKFHPQFLISFSI